jgi:voltage-gated potassium channel
LAPLSIMTKKERIYQILSDPPEGDVVGNTISISILALIALNVFVGILETVPKLNSEHASFFYYFELFSVIIFSVEYILRVWSCTSQIEFQNPIKGRLKLMGTPMAIIDILAIAPFYIQMLLPTGIDLRFIRALRLFRLFRMFRVGKLADSFKMLSNVIASNREPLFVSFGIVVVMAILAANIMYLVENGHNEAFESVPDALWWAIITITTIGYGDVYPITVAGKLIGALIGFLGICVFALPVGIIGAGFVNEIEKRNAQQEMADPENE